MALQSLPEKPAQGANWMAFGDVLYANIAELTSGFPAAVADINTLQTGKAPLNSPTFTGTVAFTGTVTGITKAMVGLGNVDNTPDTEKAFSAAQITTGTLALSRLPAGTTIMTSTTTRPTSRTDLKVIFTGADPGANAIDGDLWIS